MHIVWLLAYKLKTIKMKTLKIEIPNGFEIDKDNSTFEQIVFKEIKKQLPESWEELKNISGYYSNDFSQINQDFNINTCEQNKNYFATEEQAKASIALAQLSQLRKVYRNGWVPDCKNDIYKFCIEFYEDEIYKDHYLFQNHVFSFQDRCVLLSTIENAGKQQGLRIRISGIGAFCDIFTDTDAIGAGVIDIPDSSFIQGSDFNRSDLLIFTESARSPMWSLRFTGNDAIPFTLTQVSNSRGSQSPYGTISYLGRTSATSARGLTITDGYTIERADNKIPEYAINEIDQSRFNQCFAGAVDEDRTHYLIHPTPNKEISDRILVTNYEEDNYAVYRIPLSCMGNFTGDFDTTWNDLSIYNTWDEMAAVYGNWNSFAYSEGSTFAIGGGHNGQIFKLNVADLTHTIDLKADVGY